MPEQEYKPTLADMLEGLVYSQLEIGKRGHGDMDRAVAEQELRRRWAEALAAHDAWVRADERAKRPDRGRMAFALFLHESGQDEALLRRIWEGHPTEHPVKLNYYGLADAAISSLALEPEAREEPKLAEILARAEEVRQDDGWGIGGAWGDYGEVVVPLRILSYVIEGELDQKIASTDPGFALTYAEQERRAEEAEAKLAEAREVTSNETIPALERVGDAPTAVVREVTDAEVEAAARVMFETPDITSTDSDYTWAIMSAEDKSRADLWREDARAILEAAREVSRG